jgi:hypothetical protein
VQVELLGDQDAARILPGLVDLFRANHVFERGEPPRRTLEQGGKFVRFAAVIEVFQPAEHLEHAVALLARHARALQRFQERLHSDLAFHDA